MVRRALAKCVLGKKSPVPSSMSVLPCHATLAIIVMHHMHMHIWLVQCSRVLRFYSNDSRDPRPRGGCFSDPDEDTLPSALQTQSSTYLRALRFDPNKEKKERERRDLTRTKHEYRRHLSRQIRRRRRRRTQQSGSVEDTHTPKKKKTFLQGVFFPLHLPYKHIQDASTVSVSVRSFFHDTS